MQERNVQLVYIKESKVAERGVTIAGEIFLYCFIMSTNLNNFCLVGQEISKRRRSDRHTTTHLQWCLSPSAIHCFCVVPTFIVFETPMDGSPGAAVGQQ